MVTKGLIGRGVGYLVAHLIAVDLEHIAIVVLVGRFLADNVLLWNKYSQSYSLTLPLSSISSRIVGTPASTKSFLIGEFLRTLMIPVEKR